MIGYLAAYGRTGLRQDHQRRRPVLHAGKLGNYTIGADNTVLLGPPTVFSSANINNFNF
jgi:rhamnose transport system substrate-binding protein